MIYWKNTNYFSRNYIWHKIDDRKTLSELNTSNFSTLLKDFKKVVDDIFNIISKENIDGFVIQPTYGISEPSLNLLLNLYDVVFPYYIDVKVVPQLHKFIGAP